MIELIELHRKMKMGIDKTFAVLHKILTYIFVSIIKSLFVKTSDLFGYLFAERERRISGFYIQLYRFGEKRWFATSNR